MIKGGRWGWVGQRKVMVGKWRQLYLNNNNNNIYIYIKNAYILQSIVFT